METDTGAPWYDALLDWGRSQLGGVSGEFPVGGGTLYIGERPGAPWPLVAALLLAVIVLLALSR